MVDGITQPFPPASTPGVTPSSGNVATYGAVAGAVTDAQLAAIMAALARYDAIIAKAPVMVTSFGAVGNGVANDTAAINSAIADGSDIYIPEGTYLVDTIHVPKDKIIRGAGREKTILLHSGVGDAVFWIGNYTEDVPTTAWEASNCVVEDLSIRMLAGTKIGLRARETVYLRLRNLNIGTAYGAGLAVCTGVGLYMDGCVNDEVEGVHCFLNNAAAAAASYGLVVATSMNLAMTLGAGDGCGDAACLFTACTWDTPGTGSYIVDPNDVTFLECIWQNCHTMVTLVGSHLAQFRDCYFEILAAAGVRILGTDPRIRGTVLIEGGFLHAGLDNGIVNASGVVGVPAFYAKDVDRFVLRNMQVIGTVPLVQLVQLAGTVENVEIDANPHSYATARNPTRVAALNNAISTTLGSADIELAWAPGASVALGEVVDISGCGASPINSVPVNRPHWQVIAKTAGTVTLRPIWSTGVPVVIPQYLASASAAGLGGAIVVRWYGTGVWSHFGIPGPQVRLTDCEYEVLRFLATLPVAGADVHLLCDGLEEYEFERYSYIMGARFKTSEPLTTAPATRRVDLFLAEGGFDTYLAGQVSDTNLGIAFSADKPVLYKAFPGQRLYCRETITAAIPENVYPRLEVLEVTIAKTRYLIATAA